MMGSVKTATRVIRLVLQAIGVCALAYLLLFGFPGAVNEVVGAAEPSISSARPSLSNVDLPSVIKGCTDAQMTEAKEMLGSFVHSLDDRRHMNRGRRGFTPAEYLAFPCTRFDQTATRASTIEDVVFVMIASEKEKERAIAHRQTWANHVTMLMMADVNDTEVGLMALPAASGAGYWDAQHRTLYGMKYAVAKYPNARWFGMVRFAVDAVI
jgi:hypothetical protein